PPIYFPRLHDALLISTLQDIVVPDVQPGLPSELLRRRPDLVQAEANLRSATAAVDIAYINLFPQISLTGSVNASSTSLTELLTSDRKSTRLNSSHVKI